MADDKDRVLLGNVVEDPHELFRVPKELQRDEDEPHEYQPEDLSDLEAEFGPLPPRERD